MSATPIIGFDAKRIVRNGTGLGSYGRTLVSDLSAYPFSLRLYAPDEGRAEFRSQVLGPSNVNLLTPRSSIMPGALWRSYGIVRDLQRDGVQLYHGLSGELPIGIKRSGIKTVVTIHDLIFLRHPEFYHPIDVKLYTWKFRQTLKEADHIIAISECTKRDILYYSDYPVSQIDVIYQSCGTRFKTVTTQEERSATKKKFQLPERFILNVGTVETRKNVLLAVKALLQLPEELSLVIVGRKTKYYENIVLPYIRKYSLENRVMVLSGVADQDLPAIYQQAECFVYPSRYEGFGIPIIEAIQSGLPVVAATGSCLEEAGGPYSLYVHPDNDEALARFILQAISEREQRVGQSKQYIQRFENDMIARQLSEKYHHL